MPIYEVTPDELLPVPTTKFAAEALREREDIQRLLRRNLAVLDPDLLFIAEEYALFENANRRVDILALDRAARLVVIELKRTDDGGHMELQSLRYAAMVSTITKEHLAQVLATSERIEVDAARARLTDWVDSDSFELSSDIRIILVSAGFSQEVTATVLWLTQGYNLDISCFRLIPHRLDGKVLLDIQRIIPLPEARDFQIRQRQKGAEAAAARATGGRDFTKYDLSIAGRSHLGLSKQGAVKLLALALLRSGVAPALVRGALEAQRWVAVWPQDEETVEEAFRRENPTRGDHYWFDLEVQDAGAWWVMPRLGGRRTEEYLAALETIAPAGIAVSWAASAGSPE